MIYKMIHLKYFKRMYLTGIREFKLNFQEAVTLILGTNGSGKSCLLNEISPLPANKDAYETDGFKEIHIEHNGVTYISSTTFKKGTKCSLIRIESDGTKTELNPGGTQAVHKQLVEDIFGYTEFIHGLINNKANFSEMSPSKRREWFTSMSKVDYTFAIDLYNRIKEAHRDKVGYGKEIKNEYLDAVITTDKAKIQVLATKLSDIHLAIDATRKLKFRENRPSDELLSGYKDNVRRIKAVSCFYLESKHELAVHLTKLGISPDNISQEAANEARKQNDAKLLRSREEIAATKAKISDLEKRMQEHSEYKSENIDVHEGKIKECQTEIDSIKSMMSDKFNLGNETPSVIEKMVSYMEGVYPDLVTIISQMKSNPEPSAAVFKEKNKALSIQIGDIEAKLSDLHRDREFIVKRNEHRLEILADERNFLVCPKCQERIPRDKIPEHVSETKYDDQIKALETELSELNKTMAVYKEFSSLANQYQQLYLANSPISSLHAALIATEVVYNDATEALKVVDEYRYTLGQIARINELEKNKVASAVMVEMLRKYSAGNFLNWEDDLKVLKDKLEFHEGRVVIYQNYAESWDMVESLLGNLDKLNSDLTNLLRENEEYNKAATESLINENIDSQLAAMMIIERDLNKEYQAELRKQELSETLKSKMNEIQHDTDALNLLLEELSPTNGLIAEGLIGFIRLFLSEMNLVISRIWSYPLNVTLSEEMDEKGLTYRFPILTGIEQNEIPDVSLGSSGIKEIVNLAFKIVSMKYLGVSHFPLFLDEFGKTFDSIHRVQAGKVINTLISEQTHQQLFMVSHYSDSYGSMVNCSVVVLDDTNIVLPLGNYNQHVEIIYKKGLKDVT